MQKLQKPSLQKHSLFPVLFIVSFSTSANPLPAQTKVTLGFEISDVPCDGTVTAFPGEKVPLEVFATLTQSGYQGTAGAAGWAIAFGAAGANVRFIPGTAASGASCGTGQVIVPVPEFFCDAHVVDPDRIPDSGPLAGEPQGEGVVDGLALLIGKRLEGNATFKILMVRAEVTAPAAMGAVEEVRFYYRDGLQGPGQPVKNRVLIGRGCDPGPCIDPIPNVECRIQVKSCPCPGGSRRGGDGDQDGELTLNDAIVLLTHLFQGDPLYLPCEGESIFSTGNRFLLDANGDSEVDVSDPIHELTYLFLGGPPHVLGTGCLEIPTCSSGPCN